MKNRLKKQDPKPQAADTASFFMADQARSLFPLNTNQILVARWRKAIDEFVYQHVLKGDEEVGFLPQQHVYAAKPRHHLRRTVKLDPVAEYYVYDLVFRNRHAFRKPFTRTRRFYGYRFEGGLPVPGSVAYKSYSDDLRKARKKWKYALSFDVAAYFNTIYHHDLVKWFSDIGASPEDEAGFGQFLREINVGRSSDCLPQGIFPCKMIGSGFLVPIETSNRLQCASMLRFMDDFSLFDDSETTLTSDFVTLQKLLGDKGLSVNPSKTRLPGEKRGEPKRQIDKIRSDLLVRRGETLEASGMELSEDEEEPRLETSELEFLLHLLRTEDLEEDDADLILVLMRDHSDEVTERFPDIVQRFPNLAKALHRFCAYFEDREWLAEVFATFLKSTQSPTEFQLFWFGKIAEDYLLQTSRASEVLIGLYGADGATPISRAKILEIPERRFGMADLREEFLKTGQSDWLSWASAVGSRTAKSSQRNHLLGYFAKASDMNRLVSDCVRSFP